MNIFIFMNQIITLKSILFIFLLFNNINSKLERTDTEPEIVSETILKMINSNFLGKEEQTNIFIKNFGQYTISMKFVNIIFQEEYLDIDTIIKAAAIFSFINPSIEFILSLQISNNNNYTNTPNDTISILYNVNSNTPNLNVELKNIYSLINLKYLEFERQNDNTYKYFLYHYDEEIKKNIEIFLDLENTKYIPKIYNFLVEKKEELEQFVLSSFCLYLDEIIGKYPQPDGIYLYNRIVRDILNLNTFSLDLEEDNSIEKISINYFKEEEIIIDSPIYFINITINFEITFKDNRGTVEYNNIIPFIYFSVISSFIFNSNCKIGNTTLDSILDNLFTRLSY